MSINSLLPASSNGKLCLGLLLVNLSVLIALIQRGRFDTLSVGVMALHGLTMVLYLVNWKTSPSLPPSSSPSVVEGRAADNVKRTSTRSRLTGHILKELRQLEWDATNPYHGRKPFDPTPFKALISQVPLGARDLLVLRETNFHDNGCTTFTEDDAYFSAIRREAVDAILKLYFDEIEQAYQAAGLSIQDFDHLKALSKTFFSAGAYLYRLEVLSNERKAQ